MTRDHATAGARWDENYREPGYAFGTTANAFLVSQQHLLRPDMRALVPGDGEGRNGVWLAEQGCRVTTVDASAVGVAKAQKLAAERGVSIDARNADLLSWDWPVACFDLVASIFLHWSPQERRLAHPRMIAALAPGGLLLLEAYTPRQIEWQARGSVGGPSTADRLFTPELLRTDFAPFEIVLLEEVETVLSEGSRHTGPSSVVRLVARKQT
jgi:cyclopropane fatty-acyl-phospholipid synthase-like methyltransferase